MEHSGLQSGLQSVAPTFFLGDVNLSLPADAGTLGATDAVGLTSQVNPFGLADSAVTGQIAAPLFTSGAQRV